MTRQLRFEEFEGAVPTLPGIYEIYIFGGEALKVGVGGNLLDRYKDHRASRQSSLKLKLGGIWNNPSDVTYKKSILAKHLFFDSSITQDYDLTIEAGRRHFLQEQCYLVYEQTSNRTEAENLEKVREGSGRFRYVGNVIRR